MRNHDKLFADLIKVEQSKKVETDDEIISRKIDDIESRMSDLIDKKLESLGQNTDKKGDNISRTPAHIDNNRDLVNETDTDSETGNETGTDETINN